MKRIAVLVLALALVGGCATVKSWFGGTATDVKNLSPAQWGVLATELYKGQYDEYVAKQDLPMPESDRQVMRAKKVILVQMEPTLKIYLSYVKTGVIPPKETSDELIRLVGELTNLVAKGLK